MSTASFPAPAGGPVLTSIETARRVLDALHDAGARHLVVSPGSRSAPLAYAAAEAEASGRLTLHVRIDERDAAFTALGLSLATERPVAVLTTSGTAAGELLPAVMEAHHAGVPLVVVTADRPAELRGTGANQTTIQPGLFAGHVLAAAEIEAGADPADDVRRVLLAAEGISSHVTGEGGFASPDERGSAASVNLPLPAGIAIHDTSRGPVHLNVAFRDPLVPGPADRLPTAANDGVVPPAGDAPPSSFRGPEAADRMPTAPVDGAVLRRTVVVAGHGAGPAAEDFARRHGLPLLAEPSSNARFGAHAIGPYRLLLPVLGPLVERVVVFGRPTLSRPVARLLADPEVPAALYVPEPVSWFEPGRREERIIEDPADLEVFAGRGADGWLQLWIDAAAAAMQAMEDVLRDGPLTGPELAREVWAHAAGALVLGSSNPVRDADLLADPAAVPGARVFANRGLAGIDGTLATASGVALGTGLRTTVLLGDVTFLHDAGGLLIGRGEPEPELEIVVLNDAGGGIFSLLEHGPVAESGRYGDAVERLFGTPHEVELVNLAAAYGTDYVRVSTRAELLLALDRGDGTRVRRPRRIIDVRIDRSDIRVLHERLAAAATDAARAATRDAVS